MKRIVFCLIFIGFSSLLLAQDMLIIGKILDKKDASPIPFANVFVKGSKYGTSSNQDGFFLLRLPQVDAHTLVVSVVGYKRKEIKLEATTDQWVDCLLEEESLFLDEIVIFPGENPALALMKRVKENKLRNNPKNNTAMSSVVSKETNFSLFNVRQKSLQRKLFRALQNGLLKSSDSTYFIPLYHSIEVVENDSLLDRKEKSLDALGGEQLRELIANYVPNVNFYSNNVALFGKSFVSPLSNAGKVYYKYYLVDSLTIDNRKSYVVKFVPKNSKDLVFVGEMKIDSLSAALQSISAKISSMSNINFVNNLELQHQFERVNDSLYFYSKKNELFSFQLDGLKGQNKQKTAVLLQRSLNYENKEEQTSEIVYEPSFQTDSVIVSAIDSLNNTRLQKVAKTIVHMFLHGYVPVWKFDIGPLINTYRYNRLEGSRLQFGMRTNEKMMKNFTIGGFIGYGFRDKYWIKHQFNDNDKLLYGQEDRRLKYGLELQARFGKDYAHTLSLFCSENVEQYARRRFNFEEENMIGDVNNFISSIGWNFDDNFFRVRNATFRYKYERRNVSLRFQTEYEHLLRNHLVNYTVGGKSINRDYVMHANASVHARIGFNQRYIDGFFHRFYLNNNLPVIHLKATYGYYDTSVSKGNYGNLAFFMNHSFSLLGGSFTYFARASYTVGKVPWFLLDVMPEASSFFISENRFSLTKPMEFTSDIYGMCGFTYNTKGLIFNWIPGIKKLNLREVVSFQMAYGDILNPHHSQVLDFPVDYEMSTFNKVPYMEASIGISNILKILTVESVWRLTHRTDDFWQNWGVRVRLSLGL